jgi:hypothetical protein
MDAKSKQDRIEKANYEAERFATRFMAWLPEGAEKQESKKHFAECMKSANAALDKM